MMSPHQFLAGIVLSIPLSAALQSHHVQVHVAAAAAGGDTWQAKIDKLAASKNLNAFLLSKGGASLATQYWNSGTNNQVYNNFHLGGSAGAIHFMLSVTKTMTGLTLARAIQLGHIDVHKRVIDYVKVDGETLAPGADKITVENCFSMMSGLNPQKPGSFAEGAVAILKDSTPVTPGTYNYQDADPQLLWHVIDAACPGGANTFLETQVFGPLGITGYEWEQVSGVPKGGAGLQYKAADMLKIGQMMVSNGMLGGQQFVPASYVSTATAHMKFEGDYTYMWHHAPEGYSYSAGGGGQYIAIDVAKQLVMVTNGANDDLMGGLLDIFNEIRTQA
jgi:hypothetical protein